MKRISAIAVVSLLPTLATPAQAQDCNVLCRPKFLMQPGVVIGNALNAPTIDARGTKADATADFLFRVVTVVPTSIPRTTLVAAIQWTPFSSSTVTVDGADLTTVANSPTFVYGPVFSVADIGPVSLTFNVLGVYGMFNERDGNVIRQYRHDLALEVDTVLSLGGLLPATASEYLKQMGIYGFIAQGVTHLPHDFGANTNVLSPTLLFGVSGPIAPLP